jgi:tagatose 1,6-diphosphate aldolase
MFPFYEPGTLVDDDLELVLADTVAGGPDKAFVRTYDFTMKVRGNPLLPAGHIALRIWTGDYFIRYVGHLAYSVVPEYRGHRYAARACKLLLPLARRHGLSTLWITCNPENIASRRTCELIGAELVEVVDVPEDTPLYQRGERQKCRYGLALQCLDG